MRKNQTILTTSLVLGTSLLSWFLLRRRNRLNINPGVVTFGNDATLQKPEIQLGDLATEMNKYPNYRVVVQGNGGAHKLNCERVGNIVVHLINAFPQTITPDRFVILLGGRGEPHEINFYQY